MSFEYFPRLPAELRVHIWRLALTPREIHAYPPKDIREAWATPEATNKWGSFFNATTLLFDVMPSPLSQVCHESQSALRGYHDQAPSCDEASLPAWIDWERDFISCSQEYAAIFQNVEWHEKIQNITIKVTDVDEFDEGRYQPLTLCTDWLINLKRLTLVPSPKEGRECRKSGPYYVWPMEWFILMEILYMDLQVKFFCEVTDSTAPKQNWLTRDTFGTAMYSSSYPVVSVNPHRAAPSDEEAMRKDPDVQFSVIVTPQKDEEGNFSRFTKIRSDPHPSVNVTS